MFFKFFGYGFFGFWIYGFWLQILVNVVKKNMLYLKHSEFGFILGIFGLQKGSFFYKWVLIFSKRFLVSL